MVEIELWEKRREGELTTEYLGRVLEDYLHLPEMAKRARYGHFDDYFCPAEIADGTEIIRLVQELYDKTRLLTRNSPQWVRVICVIEAVKQGEFDGTKEESDRWVASKEGQEALSAFTPAARKKLFDA